MNRRLVVSFRFLNPYFHGRGNGGEPEWPPSPLRAFQALVAGAARSGRLAECEPAFRWLEGLPAPVIYAPPASLSSSGYRLSVPHNAMDLVARQWVRGNEGSASEHRAMKNVRPSRLPEDCAVHFVWALDHQSTHEHIAGISSSAAAVSSLGWGTDLAVAEASIADTPGLERLIDERSRCWEPRHGGATRLRAPVQGTLADLEARHRAFVGRTSLAEPTVRPPSPLSRFELVEYAREDEAAPADVAAFSLLHPEADRLRSFDTARRGMVVAGMLRHATRMAAENAGWEEDRLRHSVLGHGDRPEPRLLLIPVPSIEPREDGESVASIRRVLVFATSPKASDVRWAAQALQGAELVDEQSNNRVCVLSPSGRGDRTIDRYLGSGSEWATVTPVVLPGLDDPGGLRSRLKVVREPAEQERLLLRLHARREGLVRKALRHSGLPEELVFGAEVETGASGFFAGTVHADRYAVPHHLRQFPRFHVRVRFQAAVRGPLCVGRGRFSGLGLLAPTRR